MEVPLYWTCKLGGTIFLDYASVLGVDKFGFEYSYVLVKIVESYEYILNIFSAERYSTAYFASYNVVYLFS